LTVKGSGQKMKRSAFSIGPFGFGGKGMKNGADLLTVDLYMDHFL